MNCAGGSLRRSRVRARNGGVVGVRAGQDASERDAAASRDPRNVLCPAYPERRERPAASAPPGALVIAPSTAICFMTRPTIRS